MTDEIPTGFIDGLMGEETPITGVKHREVPPRPCPSRRRAMGRRPPETRARSDEGADAHEAEAAAPDRKGATACRVVHLTLDLGTYQSLREHVVDLLLSGSDGRQANASAIATRGLERLISEGGEVSERAKSLGTETVETSVSIPLGTWAKVQRWLIRSQGEGFARVPFSAAVREAIARELEAGQ